MRELGNCGKYPTLFFSNDPFVMEKHMEVANDFVTVFGEKYGSEE